MDMINFPRDDPSFVFLQMFQTSTEREVASYMNSRRNLNFNVHDKYNRNTLMLAICKKWQQVALTIISMRTIDFGAVDNQNKTALMHSCEQNLQQVTSQILQTGKAYVGCVSKTGWTALMYACKNFDVEAVKVMLATRKPGLDQVNSEGQDALTIATTGSGMQDVSLQLLRLGGYNPLVKDRYELPIIYCLVQEDESYQIVDELIKNHNVDPGEIFRDGLTPLIVACTGKNLKCAEILLKTGRSNPGHVTSYGVDALLVACRNSMDSTAAAILATGQCDVTLRDATGNTALGYAIFHDLSDTVVAFGTSTNASFDTTVLPNKTSPLEYTKSKGCCLSSEAVNTILEKTLDKRSLLRYFLDTDQKDKIVDLISEKSPGILDIVGSDSFKESFVSDNMCLICKNFSDEKYRHTNSTAGCGALYHPECLDKWLTYAPGQIVRLTPSNCFTCHEPIKYTPFARNGRVIVSQEQISGLDKTKIHKVCQKCKRVFEAGDRECVAAGEDTTPDTCSACALRLITCPKCGTQSEHHSGCNEYACCRYGNDACKERGSRCDHGRSDLFAFCGHRWLIDHSLMNTDIQQNGGEVGEAAGPFAEGGGDRPIGRCGIPNCCLDDVIPDSDSERRERRERPPSPTRASSAALYGRGRGPRQNGGRFGGRGRYGDREGGFARGRGRGPRPLR